MTTEEQINANRENAQLGGVKTPEGKAISRLNAVKHGILTNLLTEEENKEATQIQDELIEEYQPQTTTELILIERISIWYVRLRRAVKAESELLTMIYNPRITKSTPFLPELPQFEEVIKEGYTPKVKVTDIDTLEGIYLRYESALERNFFRALHELQRIQLARSGEKVPAPLALDIVLDKGDKNIDG
jgi:hypothetical protein